MVFNGYFLNGRGVKREILLSEAKLFLILHFSGGGVEKGLTNPRITAAAATKNDEDLVQEIIMTKDKDTKMIIKKSCVIIAITEKRRISIRENLEVEAEKDAIESSTIEHLK